MIKTTVLLNTFLLQMWPPKFFFEITMCPLPKKFEDSWFKAVVFNQFMQQATYYFLNISGDICLGKTCILFKNAVIIIIKYIS